MVTRRTTFNPAHLVVALVMTVIALVGCEREPPLHLHYGNHLDYKFPEVQIDLKVLWAYDVGYDWEAEWTYGWDDEDVRIFGGPIGYTEPTDFDILRYYTAQVPYDSHCAPDKFYVSGNTFKTTYNFGYYDILVHNHFDVTQVHSLVFDDETTYDSIMVFTNPGMFKDHYHQSYANAFNEPEELFAAYERALHISDNYEDYDDYDPVTHTYIKYARMTLQPITYIYLPQVRIHNNRGRVYGVSGEGNLSGMARGATLNSGRANRDAITVHFYTNFKRNRVIRETGKVVDVAGGRCLTFGIPNQNSARVGRADEVRDVHRHYMDMNFVFNNGLDSTFVFDVTDQVRKHYRGGVLTIDIDMDTIPIPKRSGGSGFDAVVKDFEEETYEFEMARRKRRR